MAADGVRAGGITGYDDDRRGAVVRARIRRGRNEGQKRPADATPEEYRAGSGAEGSQRATSWVDLSNLGAGSGGATGSGYESWGAAGAARPHRRGYGGLVLAFLLAATGVLGVLDAAGLISLSWLSGGALVPAAARRRDDDRRRRSVRRPRSFRWAWSWRFR